MKISHSTRSVVSFAYLFCNIRHAEAAGRTVSDYRIRDHDLTPVLGRGFSLATGTLQSSCLEVVERTRPSYDYDYYFTEVKSSSEEEVEKSFEGKFKGSFSYWGVKVKIKASVKSASKSNTKKSKRFIIATMRTERYYDSVDEIHARLSSDAHSLLASGQYISFFQACGPNYIRSIRRAQEVTAIFEYESESKTGNSEFEAKLKVDISGWGQKASTEMKYESKSKHHSENSSLKISIVGYGLGLNEDGAGSLIAKSMDDYMKVMEFAFRSMQATGIGMVQSIEIVPWVDNPQFQVAAGLATILQDCGEDPEEEGKVKKCTSVASEIKKMHLSANGEYVATMNQVMRMNIDRLHNMQQCRGILHSWPTEYGDKNLINIRTSGGFVEDGKSDESHMTVGEMKEHVNAENMMKQQEYIQGYIEYFYAPCITALSREYGGQIGGITMVKSWFMIEECREVLCTVKGAIASEGGKCTVGGPNVAEIAQDLYCMPVLEEAVNQ